MSASAFSLAKEHDSSLSPDSYNRKVLDTIYKTISDDSKFILITSEHCDYKNRLVKNIGVEIAANSRLIFMRCNKLPLNHSTNRKLSTHKNKQNNSLDINYIIDHIKGSASLNEKITVLLDNADALKIQQLNTIVSASKELINNNSDIKLILTGSTEFKDELMSSVTFLENELVTISIDKLTEDTILEFIVNKNYQIESNIKRITFDEESLGIIIDFIGNDLNKLDVLLEWCSFVAATEQLEEFTEENACHILDLLEQHSIKYEIDLKHAYPPLPYEDDTEDESEIIAEKETINENEATDITKIPTITTLAESANNSNKPVFEIVSDEIPKFNVKKIDTFPGKKPLFIALTTGLIIFISLVHFSPITKKSTSVHAVEISLEKNISQKLNIDIAAEDIPATNLEPINSTEQTSLNIIPPNVQTNLNEKSKTHTAIENQVKENELDAHVRVEKTVIEEKSENLSNDFQALLNIAKLQFGNKKLTSPSGDNAYETYHAILSMDPNNADAIKGVDDIHARYVSWGKHYENSNDLKRAKYFYSKALEIYPHDQAIKESIRKLSHKKTTNPQEDKSFPYYEPFN